MTDITHLTPRRILVCQLRQIGDVILSTIVVRLLNERWPQAEIHVLTEAKCAPVLEHNPRITRIIPLDKAELKNPLKALAFYRRTGKGFDLLVDLQQLPRLRFVAGFSDAPVKLSFTPPWYNRLLYTHWSKPMKGYAGMCKSNLLRPLGISWNGEPPEMVLTEEERDRAGRFLANHGVDKGDLLVTVDATHKRDTRRWAPEHFGNLMAMALERFPMLRFVLLFGPGERDSAAQVAEACPAGRDRIILPEQNGSLRDAAALIQRAGLHLGNCSAPRHMAVALGVPTLTVLGGNSAGWLFPSPDHEQLSLGLDCQPCNRETCPKNYECIRDMTPDKVLPSLTARIESILEKR